MIKVVTDSTADVPQDFQRAHGIGWAPTILEIDGQTFYDNVTLTRPDFYRNLNSYKAFPKTAAASPATFVDLYWAAGADEIISVHLSPKFSSMSRSAAIAAEDVAGEGIRVHVIDSHSLSLGVGWLVMRAAEMAAAGESSAAILSELEGLRKRIKLLVMFDTLKNLRKGGRVSALTAGIGELLQIKLLVDIYDDEFHQLDKVRTRGRGVERLIEAARSAGAAERLAVIHAGEVGGDVSTLQSRLADLMPVDKQLVIETTPGLGAHTGVAALGVSLVQRAP
jgi:DegV family protein with EDD domain